MKSTAFAFLWTGLLIALPACRESEKPADPGPAPIAEAPAPAVNPVEVPLEVSLMRITSSAFENRQSIPSRYTCDGDDLIPPLSFEEIPAGATSLALVMDDPDVPPPGSGRVWDHWVVWNIPSTTRSIEEGVPPQGVQGRNSWGRNDWGGPCPPDREHRYFFRLYALDTILDLGRSSGKKDLERAMEEHILAKAELIGLYNRKR